ncbi:MAG TPA: hypothetical protein V6D11_19220 [Waterburya sp.]
MTQNNIKPSAKVPLSERHHSDPPGLWATVILTSFVIHLFGFGMLRLWLTIRLDSFQAARDLIPIDVMAVASQVPSPSQPIQRTTSSAAPATGVNPPTSTSKTLPNRQPSSSPPVSTSKQTNTQRGAGKASPTVKGLPQNQKSSTTKTNPAKKPSPRTTSGKGSPAPNPSPNQPSGTPTPSPKPDKTTDNGTKSGGSGTPSPSNPTPSPGSSGGPTSSNSQEGGGFQADSTSPLLISGSLNDTPKELAKIKIKKTEFPADSPVAQLASNLDQPLTLEVYLLIDQTGKPTIQSVMPVSPVSSEVNLTELVQAIFQNWQFEATKNTQGQEFSQAYQLSLKITPRSK